MKQEGAAGATMHDGPMLSWGAAFTSMKGYAAVETAREEWMAQGIRRAAAQHQRLLVVLPYARTVGVAELLARA